MPRTRHLTQDAVASERGCASRAGHTGNAHKRTLPAITSNTRLRTKATLNTSILALFSGRTSMCRGNADFFSIALTRHQAGSGRDQLTRIVCGSNCGCRAVSFACCLTGVSAVANASVAAGNAAAMSCSGLEESVAASTWLCGRPVGP